MAKIEFSFHNKVSIVKSIFRILAGASLIGGFLVAAGANLIIAEILGIIEEVS